MDYAQVLERIQAEFPEVILEKSESRGELRITVKKDAFPELMKFLHDDAQLRYDLLTDIVAVDYMARTPRFEVIYNLFAMDDFRRLFVKLKVAEGEDIPSVIAIWKAADWQEREVYDLMGIGFTGHPDLRRILTWDNFEGHPLRKDYPLLGKDFDKKFDPDTIEVL